MSIDRLSLLFLLIPLLIILAAIYLSKFSVNGHDTGEVINKYYAPATSSIGTGIANTPNGSGPVVTTSYTSEEFTVEVRLKQKTSRFQVDNKIFDSCQKGSKVRVDWRKNTVLGSERYWVNSPCKH